MVDRPGPAVLLPLLNPVDVAEQVATLDVITEARLVFGVARGEQGRFFHLTRAHDAPPGAAAPPARLFAANAGAAVVRAARVLRTIELLAERVFPALRPPGGGPRRAATRRRRQSPS